MLRLSHDLTNGELDNFTMPTHIHKALDFLLEPMYEKPNEMEDF